MTETASPDSGQALSRENIQQLGVAALALLGSDGRPTLYVDKDNNPRGARLARLGPSPSPGVAFLELKADERALRGVDAYFVKRERKFSWHWRHGCGWGDRRSERGRVRGDSGGAGGDGTEPCAPEGASARRPATSRHWSLILLTPY